MGIDLKRMRRSYEQHQRGGDLFSPSVGQTLLYVHGQCRPDDEHEPTVGLNHIPLVMHYGLGKDRAMCVCLDPERNPIIRHPFVVELLKKRGVKVGSKCPACLGIEDGSLSSEAADEASPTTRFLWGVTPIGHKPVKTAEHWSKLPTKASVMLQGVTLYNGFMDAFFEAGDITDVDAAVFLVVEREGKGRYDTKYSVKVHTEKGAKGSIGAPLKLPTAFRQMLTKVLQPGGDCDLFRIVVNMVKTPEDIKALMAGVSVATSEGASESEGEDLLADDDDDGSTELTADEADDELADGEDDAPADDAPADDEVPADDAPADDGDDLVDTGDEGGDLLPEDDAEDTGDDLTGDDTGEGDDVADDATEAPEAPPAPPVKPAPKPAPKPALKPAPAADADLGLDELDAELAAVTAKAAKPAAPATKPIVPAKRKPGPGKPAPKA